MENPDQQLINDLQNPRLQRQAFARVVSLYSERLYWQIRKMVISHDDTHDVLQNTFLKAWSNLEGFRGDSKLSTWLYRIAINESLNFLSKNRDQIGSTEVDELLMANLESDVWIDGDELLLKLQRAIVRLPDKQRLVFNLRYYDEMKYEEMSELLGTSVGALKASYHHAAKKVEEYILNDV